MGERKVVNKYYPPDCDPANIPRRRQPNNKQIPVRMMLPMSIHCKTCNNYIYKGTKFNSRKEDVVGDTYLGIQVFRFCFNCTHCCAEIVMKTDPQNSDYVVESGAERNFEPWRGEKRKRDDSEEMGRDAMKSLEERSLDSKREIDNMAALDELKSMKSRRARVSRVAMLEAFQRSAPVQEDKLEEEEEDEAMIKYIFRGSKEFVRRISDDDLRLTLSGINDSEPSDSTRYLTKTSTSRVHWLKKPYGRVILESSLRVSGTKPLDNCASSGLKLICQQYDSVEDD